MNKHDTNPIFSCVGEMRMFFSTRARIRRALTACRRAHRCWRATRPEHRLRWRRRRGRTRLASVWPTTESCRSCPHSKVTRTALYCQDLIGWWKVSCDIIGVYCLAPPTRPWLHRQKRKVVSEVEQALYLDAFTDFISFLFYLHLCI